MAINRKKIIDDMSRVMIKGDKNGMIEAFNVFVNQMPIEFWNNFADRLAMKTEPALMEATEYLLINAAHECGYHTT